MAQLKDKIVITNLAPWVVAFRRATTIGDVVIPPKGKLTIASEEVMAQVYKKSKLFVGDDGEGSHARIFIEDKDTRVEALFESEDGDKKQNVFLESDAKSLFQIKPITSFKKEIKDKVVSDAEKALLVELAIKYKVNDYDKIKFIQEYTGLKIN